MSDDPTKTLRNIPVWGGEAEADEQDRLYGAVHHHSPGMISFTYRPPTQADLDALKDTETFRAAQREGLLPKP